MKSRYLDISKFNIRDDYAEFGTRVDGVKYLKYVYGTVTIDQDYDYLEIEVPVYDIDGNLIEKFTQYVTRVRAGENWKFRVMGFRTDGVSYDITKADISND